MAVALTTLIGRFDNSQSMEFVIDVTFSSTYATGGVSITAMLAGSSLYHTTKLPFAVEAMNTGATYLLDWDAVNNKLIFYVRTTGLQLADTTAISNTARLRILYSKS